MQSGDRGEPFGSGAGPTDDPEGRELEQLRRRVTAAVRRHCPAWLAGHAEDIVQNTVLKLYKSMTGSDGKRTFSSVYVEKSVCGAVVDEIRRACRRKESPVDEPATMDRIATPDTTPERNAASREIARGILDCLARLIRPRRLAVTLYLYGCTVPEAAGRLGWPLRKTESLVYRGLADLRGCLGQKGLRP